MKTLANILLLFGILAFFIGLAALVAGNVELARPFGLLSAVLNFGSLIPRALHEYLGT